MSEELTPLQDDMTLADARRDFEQSMFFERLIQVHTMHQIRIRFVRISDDTNLPDTMLVSEFRTLAIANLAKLVIDDLSGGTAVRPPSPELVR